MASICCTPPSWCVTASKHDAAQRAKDEEARRKQYDEAMAWCTAKEKSAYAASILTSDDEQGLRWPLISERGLRERLTGNLPLCFEVVPRQPMANVPLPAPHYGNPSAIRPDFSHLALYI